MTDVNKGAENLFLFGLAVHAYIVRPSAGVDWDDQFLSVLVYADSEASACEVGAASVECEPEDCTAIPEPLHDARAATFFIGCVERDPEYLRTAGWRMEGEWTCGACGLAAFGMEKYGVCRATTQCKQCGCEDRAGDDPPCAHEEGFSCG